MLSSPQQPTAFSLCSCLFSSLKRDEREKQGHYTCGGEGKNPTNMEQRGGMNPTYVVSDMP